MANKKFTFKFPDAYVLMVLLVAVAAIMTFIIPAGEYDRIEDSVTHKMVVQADSYHEVEQQPVGAFEAMLAIPKGLSKSAVIIFFVLMIGGTFGVINATGSLDALMSRTINKFNGTGNDKLIIIGLIVFFSFVSAVVGMFGECIAFIPIIVVLMISLGYDAIVGVAIVMASICVGYGASTINPFNVGLAQGIAGLPLYSGLWFRWGFWLVSVAVLIWYVLRYCKKIKKDPSKSLVKDIDYSDLHIPTVGNKVELTWRHKGVLGVFFGGIFLLIYLIIQMKFGMVEMSAYFMVMGIVAGAVYGMGVNEIAQSYIKGAQNMVYAALLVGFARGIAVVLTDGKILDTIVYSMSLPLQHLPKSIAAGSMVLMQSAFNFFVPSGTGQAMVTMPVMAPLADVVGFNRQVAVLAFHMGDGFANAIMPTVGVLLAALGMGRVPYSKWFKFMGKLFIIQLIIAFAACMLAVTIGLV